MKHDRQSGFALLFVFAMAAIVAIALYIALPRVSFEAQRDKEALLIERGEQYKRGIQLYVRKFRRFPAKIEDLDSSNGIRFLRHHYVDPMTGKDEWRLIHAGPGGVLLDSLIKKDTDKDKKVAGQTSITELLGAGGLPEADATANPALRKRPSDQQTPPGSANGATPPGTPIPPDPPQFNGTLAGVQNPANPFPGNVAAGSASGAGTLPGRLPTTNQAATPANSQTSSISGGFGIGGSGVIGSPAGASGVPVPGIVTQQTQNPAASGFAPPGATPTAQGATEAARLIQGLLTTPRPGGLAGIQNSAAVQGQTIGGGIAGVASTIKSGSGIKVYNDQDEYKKWEFVYDATKEAQNAGAIPQQGRPPGTPIGQPAAGLPASGPPTTSPQTTGNPVTPPQ